jgi:hypothetical protein
MPNGSMSRRDRVAERAGLADRTLRRPTETIRLERKEDSVAA